MRIAYFDCFSGISGDMTLGALLACGLPEAALREGLELLGMTGWKLDVAETEQNGIGATDVTVTLTEPQGHGRHLHHIAEILDGSKLADSVKSRSLAVFTRLAEAEAKIHQTSVERIHFHEVGAVDAIVDIVGTCIGLDALGVEEVRCSALPIGRGFVECMHGTIPLPAPATLELTRGLPVYGVDVEGELVTPTGAALIATLSREFGVMPPMTVRASGYGSGKKRFGSRPNLLRVVVGDSVEGAFTGAAEVTVLETNLDDMSPQVYELLAERLLEAGAADVFVTPIQMKKSRPATLLTVLSPPEQAEALATLIFQETTTLGIRIDTQRRLCLDREWRPVETRYGTIRVKVGRWQGEETTASPEYEDVKAAARAHKAPLKIVYQAAVRAYEDATG